MLRKDTKRHWVARTLLLASVAILACASEEPGFCSVGVDTLPISHGVEGHTLAIHTFDGLVVVDQEGRREVPGSAGVETYSWDRKGTGFFVTRGGVLGFLPIDGGEVQEIYADWRQVRFPALSPDGQTIAVSANLSDDIEAGWEIWLLGRSGGNPTPLVPGYNPSWSPDGSRLYFEQHEPSVHLTTIDLATGETTPLLSDSERDIGIEVSPLGTYAAFSRGHERRLMLYTFRDSTLVALTDGSYYDEFASFSSGEDFVVFHRQSEPADGSVVLQIIACDLATGRNTLVDEGAVIEASFAPPSIER